jgi:hypothetical protein
MNLVKLLAGILIIATVFGCGSSGTQDSGPPDLTAKPTGPRPGVAVGGGTGPGNEAKAALAN